MLAVLTHTGLATTQMVGNTLEMLWFDFKELIENTVVIFNMTPSLHVRLSGQSPWRKPARDQSRSVSLHG
jgi:hypothetical protein